MLAFSSMAMLLVVGSIDDDPLGIPEAPAAVAKRPPRLDLPDDAGAAQKAARDRWKPWEREDKPGPSKLPDPPPPSSVMRSVNARQTAPIEDEPLKPIPRDELHRTPSAEMPSRTSSRLPLDDSLMTPPHRPPTPELEVFPAPPREDGSQLCLPAAPPMLGDVASPFLPINNPRFRRAIVHQLGASRFKVADNNSPLPDTRGFSSFNYFQGPFEQDGRLYKGTSGFEFAFAERRASVDVRAGIGVFTHEDDSNAVFGTNPSAVVKALFFESGNLRASGGFGISIPGFDSPNGAEETDFVFSPFIGWIWTRANTPWFVHGFEQVDVPLGDGEMRLQSDVGVGYWFRRDDQTKLITAWAPTAELHLYTPLEGDPKGDREGLPSNNVLNATIGVTTYFGPADSLAIGLGTPLLGAKHYEWEGHLHFIHRF